MRRLEITVHLAIARTLILPNRHSRKRKRRGVSASALPPRFRPRSAAPAQRTLLLYLGRAPINKELDTVNKAGITRRKEKRHRSDFFRTAHLTTRNKGPEALLGIGA
jgi:hypothetical protein